MRLRALAVALVVLALAGCGRHPSIGAKIKLTVFTWTLPAELAVNQRLCKQFGSSHPNLQVTVVNEPSKRAMDKLQTMIAAGNPPDVMSIHGATFMPMAANGALLDLGPLIKADPSFDLDDFYPKLVETCRYQGKLYSLPRYTSVYVLFYNKDLFDAAGLKYPDENWTWESYLAAARKLTVSSPDPERRRMGCVIDFWGARIYPWVWSAGGEILDKSGKVCLLDRPEPQQALQFLVDLRHKYQVCPPSTQQDSDQNKAMFANGKVAMYQSGAWDIQILQGAKGLRWDIAPLPKRKKHATMLGTENYAIAAATKHPKEAWELFKFLLGPESQTTMGREMEKQPSRQSVANGPYLKQNTTYHRKVFIDALTYAHAAPNIPDWDRVSHFIQEQLDLMWIGKVSVAEGTKKASQQVTDALHESSP